MKREDDTSTALFLLKKEEETQEQQQPARPFDMVAVTDHAIQNVLMRGKPRLLRKLARTGFLLEHFLAGIVMRQEFRSKKVHPPIGANEEYVFAAFLSRDTGPLHLMRDIVLIVGHDTKNDKKWVVLTAMTREDYQHRIDIEKINSQPHKLPGTSGQMKGSELLSALAAKSNNSKQNGGKP